MRKETLEELTARLEAERPELERIMLEHHAKRTTVDTGRKPQSLICSSDNIDFTAKEGNTEYEVVGCFDPDAEQSVLQRILRKLGYSYR